MADARSTPGNPDLPALDAERERLFAAERGLLDDLRTLLESFGAAREDQAVLRQALRDLDDIFLLVVVGEFNAGKSAFINALVGSPVLEEGVTPTTTAITVLRHGEQAATRQTDDEQVEVTHPAEFLRAVSIVDTPGTNAVIRRHEQLTVSFIPRSDLIIFLTSVDRPFTESERAFLEAIRGWGKKVVLVVNKVDILRNAADLERVAGFVREQARALLGLTPEVYPISARLAAEAKAPGHPEERRHAWEASRFGPLEEHIRAVLDDRGRVKLKLLSPLGVGERLCARYLATAGERLAVLAEDARTVENIDTQLEIFRQDMERDFAHRLLEIENIVHEMRERGDRFFDETLRLGRIFDLINAERIRGAFEREVLAGSSERIDQAVQDLIDWMVQQELRLWQAINEYLQRRRQAVDQEHLIGQLGTGFDYSRRELLQSVARGARQVLESFDREGEARQLAASMREAVTQTAVAGAGAVSLGTLVAVLIGTAAADVTGVLAASVIAGLGLYIIPARKRRARAAFQDKARELREQLSTAMQHQFRRELDEALRRIREATAPYTRFVRAEQQRLGEAQQALEQVDHRLEDLHRRVESL